MPHTVHHSRAHILATCLDVDVAVVITVGGNQDESNRRNDGNDTNRENESFKNLDLIGSIARTCEFDEVKH